VSAPASRAICTIRCCKASRGLLLRFQTAYEPYQTRPADGKKVFESAIEQTAQAITEGREAVQGLRTSTRILSIDRRLKVHRSRPKVI
jgi:hypothetical protein